MTTKKPDTATTGAATVNPDAAQEKASETEKAPETVLVSVPWPHAALNVAGVHITHEPTRIKVDQLDGIKAAASALGVPLNTETKEG